MGERTQKAQRSAAPVEGLGLNALFPAASGQHSSRSRTSVELTMTAATVSDRLSFPSPREESVIGC